MMFTPTQSYPIVVHSHLHWDWVWQRPQQFLSRLSSRHPIFFVESPHWDAENGPARAELSQSPDFPNITILQMHLPESRRWDEEYVDAERRRLFCEHLTGAVWNRFKRAVVWYYDPQAISIFSGTVDEIAVVYDCMDELSQFKFAPPSLVRRERELLRRADVVFTGGRKMWESKSRYNDNCHFYGCGVDIEHFGKARSDKTALPEDLKNISSPILGYFGVVDERLDYDLIAKLADANPDWSLVIVGPIYKVDPNQVPQRPNIHWMGKRDYSQLPTYVKGFDACLMPFALNEATEYINPTKALEYMATSSPIVSSAVPDVVSNFSTVVKVADSHEEFIGFCQEAVTQPDTAAIARGLRMANENTWDAIVAKMEKHINEAIKERSVLHTAIAAGSVHTNGVLTNGVLTNGVHTNGVHTNGNGRTAQPTLKVGKLKTEVVPA